MKKVILFIWVFFNPFTSDTDKEKTVCGPFLRTRLVVMGHVILFKHKQCSCLEQADQEKGKKLPAVNGKRTPAPYLNKNESSKARACSSVQS